LRPPAGPPDETEVAFEVAAPGRFCLRVVNAGIAAAWISIDGLDVLGPGDFNPHLTSITARPALQPGTHALAVRVASRAGASLSVEVRQAPLADPVDTRVGPEELVAISDFSDDPIPSRRPHQAWRPRRPRGHRHRTRHAGRPVESVQILAAGRLRDRRRCSAPIQTLTVEAEASADVAPAPAPPGMAVTEAASWSRRTYFYRATVGLVRRRRSTGDRETLDAVVSAVQAVTAIDPHGVRDMTTRELTAQVRELKSHGESYHDLSAVDRACYDASMAARAARRTQKHASQRFFPVADLFPGDTP
jgi:hypothetical protein